MDTDAFRVGFRAGQRTADWAWLTAQIAQAAMQNELVNAHEADPRRRKYLWVTTPGLVRI